MNGTRRELIQNYVSSYPAISQQFIDGAHKNGYHKKLQEESHDREKEREQNKKITDLTSQVHKLEKRVTSLKTENETLKRKTEEQKPSEEKIKKLKRRNAELAAIARRLEEKAKQLQQENAKRREGTSPSQDVEQVKKTFAKQRAKDIAEYAQKSVAKDKELETLRQKCSDLTLQLTNTSISTGLPNAEIYEDKDELESVIKLAAKERLLLERQISTGGLKPQEPNESDVTHIKSLEESNESLKAEVEKLIKHAQHTEKLEIEVTQKKIECENLYKEVDGAKSKCDQLECDLQEVIEKNTQLTVHNSDLQQRIHELEKVSEEYELLKETLTQVEEECRQAKEEAATLQAKVKHLDSQVQQLRAEVDNKKQLEHDHQEALVLLRQKEEEIKMLTIAQKQADQEHDQALGGLQSHLRELERKYELQALKHEELTLEMDELRKEAERAKQKPDSQHILIQTDTPRDGTPSNVYKDVSNAYRDPSNAYRDPSNMSLLSSDSGAKFTKPESNRRKDGKSPLVAKSPAKSPLVDVKKTPFKVYVAKYSYDPDQFSPNECPESELSINAGDYIFVYGEMDEDGFFEGELMDGRKGLVPSNFVEKVPDEELEEFYQTIGLRQSLQDEASSLNDSVHHHDLDFNSSDEDESRVRKAMTEAIQDSEEEEIVFDEVMDNYKVPPPVSLKLERQLSNSILISWTPPSGLSVNEIQSYHVYVDGQFKTSVKGTERTKALVEGVSSIKGSCVCVRTVTNKGQSDDVGCTLTVGKGVSQAPRDVVVSDITAISVLITWYPGDSSAEHVITLNNKLSSVTRPGCHACTITGIKADYKHKVGIQCKSSQPGSHTTTVQFNTKPGGRPDAPLDVQVDTGPQEGTLLVTWLPVTIATTGKSNGAPVTGYAIYVDGIKTKDLNSPTGDHTILESKHFPHTSPPKHLTVRTIGEDNLESRDSQSVNLTPQMVHEVTRATGIDGKLPPGVVEELVDSELSDITEVEEEEDTSHRTPHITPKHTPRSQASTTPKHSPRSQAGSQHHGNQSGSQHPRSPTNYVSPRQASSTHSTPRTRVDEPRHQGQRKVDGGPGDVGFRPIKESNHGDRLPPGGADSPPKANHILVPHIEITKDSSGSTVNSGPENFSDENRFNGHPPPHIHKPVPQHAQAREGQHQREHRPGSGTQRPHSGKDVMRKRDYFNDRRGHDARGGGHDARGGVSPRDHRGGHSPRDYDDDYSFSTLEDNNYVTSKKIRDDIPDSDLIDYEDDGGDSLIDSVPEMELDETRVRIFIALFDYDPVVMSPNPEAVDEELPFKEGQLIKIFGDKDPDGFYVGEANGKRGYVPCNMVSEVQVDDPEIAAQLLKESNRAASSARTSRGPSRSDLSRTNGSRSVQSHRSSVSRDVGMRQSPSRSPRGRSPNGYHGEGPRRRMVALYDYDPQELSPNVDAEVELSFRTGDVIYVYGDMDEDGFFYGEDMGNNRGLVPSNFLSEPPPTFDEYSSHARAHNSPRGIPHDRRDRANPPMRDSPGPRHVESPSSRGRERNIESPRRMGERIHSPGPHGRIDSPGSQRKRESPGPHGVRRESPGPHSARRESPGPHGGIRRESPGTHRRESPSTHRRESPGPGSAGGRRGASRQSPGPREGPPASLSQPNHGPTRKLSDSGSLKQIPPDQMGSSLTPDEVAKLNSASPEPIDLTPSSPRTRRTYATSPPHSPARDDKTKDPKKKGLFSKSKNIFKKFSK